MIFESWKNAEERQRNSTDTQNNEMEAIKLNEKDLNILIPTSDISALNIPDWN